MQGLIIDGVEYKLMQYLNDLSIIFYWLPLSMDGKGL